MPFDLSDIPEEFRRNPKPYVALALVAVVVLGAGLAYRKVGQARDKASVAKSEAKLKSEGLLLLSDEHGDANGHGCCLNGGFFVAWLDSRHDEVTFANYIEPWNGPQSFNVDIPPHVLAAATDVSQKRIALASSGNRQGPSGLVRVWAVSAGKWQVLRDIPERDLPRAVALSADGTRIAHASGEEVVVTSIAEGKRLFSCPTQATESLGFHPSGDFIAVSGNPMLLIGLKGAPLARQMFVGGKFAFTREQREMLEENGATDDSLDHEPPVGKELSMTVGFSRDGRWLWCGTNNGVRVYDWATVIGSPGSDMPAPTFSFTPPSDPPKWVGMGAFLYAQKHVHAIVEERDSKGIVFGGQTGRLYRLDLETGKPAS